MAFQGHSGDLQPRPLNLRMSLLLIFFKFNLTSCSLLKSLRIPLRNLCLTILGKSLNSIQSLQNGLDRTHEPAISLVVLKTGSRGS